MLFKLFVLIVASALNSIPAWCLADFPATLSPHFLQDDHYFQYFPKQKCTQESCLELRLPSPVDSDTRVSDSSHFFVFVRKRGSFVQSEKLSSPASAPEFFSETHWIKMDPQTQIMRIKVSPYRNDADMNSASKIISERWIFPVGTTLVHCLYFQEKPDRLRECRFEALTTEGWEFATYLPQPTEKVLKKMEFSRSEFTSDFVEHPRFGQTMITYKEIPLNRCATCHALEERHGKIPEPCGFKPEKLDLDAAWIKQYSRKRGLSLFSDLN